MIVYVHACYPGHVLKPLLDAFMSEELPRRPDHVKELGSITYSDQDGFHASYLFEVEDSKVGELIQAQTQRNIFLGTRVEGITFEMQMGLPLSEGVPMTMQLLPK